jgi:hypothetical protein
MAPFYCCVAPFNLYGKTDMLLTLDKKKKSRENYSKEGNKEKPTDKIILML